MKSKGRGDVLQGKYDHTFNSAWLLRLHCLILIGEGSRCVELYLHLRVNFLSGSWGLSLESGIGLFVNKTFLWQSVWQVRVSPTLRSSVHTCALLPQKWTSSNNGPTDRKKYVRVKVHSSWYIAASFQVQDLGHLSLPTKKHNT